MEACQELHVVRHSVGLLHAAATATGIPACRLPSTTGNAAGSGGTVASPGCLGLAELRGRNTVRRLRPWLWQGPGCLQCLDQVRQALQCQREIADCCWGLHPQHEVVDGSGVVVYLQGYLGDDAASASHPVTKRRSTPATPSESGKRAGQRATGPRAATSTTS
jgi:hypothetical protein